MFLAEIVDISLIPSEDGSLLGSGIDSPPPQSCKSSYSMTLEGWVVARDSPAQMVEVVAHIGSEDAAESVRQTVATAQVRVQRPEVLERFGDQAQPGPCGFKISFGLLGLPTEFKLLVRAQLANSERVPVAHINARRGQLTSDFRPEIQPALLNSLRRSGSTWMTRLLGQHPEIVTYRPFRLEPRISSYWIGVLDALSQPASWSQAVRPLSGGQMPWSIADRHHSAVVDFSEEPAVEEWLAKDSVEELAAFCQSRIDGFYCRLAASQGKTDVRYFAERGRGLREMALINELYADAREVFLVRDFRDVLCSRIAYRAKTGLTLFQRDRAASDEDYVRNHMRGEVAYLLKNWQQRRDGGFLVRYEDLVQREEETLRGLFDYVGVDSSPATVHRVIEESRALSPVAQQRHKTSEADQASTGRWRHELDGSLQAVCEEALGEALGEFGYL